MPLSANDILVYDGAQWVNQHSIDSPTFYVDTTNHRVGIGTTSPGVSLHVAGASGGDLIRVTPGSGAITDEAYIDVNSRARFGYDGGPPELVVISDNGTNKPIGFICHAGWVPISAGVLKGRRITCVSAIKDDVVNAGAEYVNEPVVVDGNFVTSRTPEDLPVWLPALIERIAQQS